ncbi:MAG: PEP-CTERM sorting domain-containing protein [Pseudomonadota bacterium]
MPPRALPLALLALPLSAPAASLSTSQTLSDLVLLSPSHVSVSDTSPDGAAPLLTDTLTLGFAAFDPNQGVLTGVSGQVAVDPGHALMAYRNESGGDWDSVAYVRSTWTLGSTALASGSTTMQTVTANRDTPVVIGTAWTPTAFSAANLDGFVGTGTLNSSFTSYLGAFIDDGGGGSVAIASVLETTGAGTVPDTDGLTGSATWEYQWLRHADLSFAGAANLDGLALDLANGPADFLVHALGDEFSTGADLLGWTCSGDCASFALLMDDVNGLAVGATAAGSVNFLGGGGSHAARFTLHFADDDAIGAAATRLGHDLVLDVAVTPVPEPGTYALFLAGLGLLALATGQRRRPAHQPARTASITCKARIESSSGITGL